MTTMGCVWIITFAFLLPAGPIKAIFFDSIKMEDYNYHAAVVSGDLYLCSAAIINEHNILSSASCLSTLSNPLQVSVGSLKYSKGQKILIEEIFKHPKFNPLTGSYDVAVARIATPLNFTSSIGAVALADEKGAFPENGAVVSGFGGFGACGLQSELKTATFSTADLSECSTVISVQDDNGVVCGKLSSCLADSGAPVVQNGTLVAILTYSTGADNLGLYLKTGDFLDFINRAVSHGEVSVPPLGLLGLIKALIDCIRNLFS